MWPHVTDEIKAQIADLEAELKYSNDQLKAERVRTRKLIDQLTAWIESFDSERAIISFIAEYK